MTKKKTSWEKRKFYERKQNIRFEKDRFLLVCEGQQTEPNYFKGFPVDAEVIDLQIFGEGRNTDSLVEKALQLKKKAERKKQPYIQVWCIFDYDDFPAQNFHRAFQIAESNQIKIAYSNQAFELWYLLHFHFYNAPMFRKTYITKLNKFFSPKYQKNDPDIYKKLQGKQEQAIRNAKKLLASYPSYLSPIEKDPSTTVYELVEELNRYCE